MRCLTEKITPAELLAMAEATFGNLVKVPKDDENFIEFDAMINLRPLDDNRSRTVENPEVRERIIAIVKEWVA